MTKYFSQAVTRHAAGIVSRRGSFLALGSAALAAAVPPATAAKKRRKGKAKKRCKRQVGQCRAYFAEACATNAPGQEAECEATFFPCCEPFQTCNAAGFFACLEAMA